MIQMIEINKISHHPHNPRKDLGDLTELADSIKQSGILQNLTVVPWFSIYTGVGSDDPKQQEELRYYALIGNRRLAAAKLAGLTEVPCAVADLDKKEQVATMLLENMQRADLTAYEQAQGIQMMMDFGESVTNISEKTGFSESTVRRRMKLLELDQDKLKESTERGATLSDYMELEKIEDLERRNKVLEKIGTNDFQWALKDAINREEKIKETAKIIEVLEEFAERIESTTKDDRVFRNIWGLKDVEVPEDKDTVDYYYVVNSHYITLYKRSSAEETEELNNEEEERRRKELLKQEKRAKLEEISKRAFKLREDFIKNISNSTAKKNISAIVENNIYAIVEAHGYIDYNDIINLLDYEIVIDEDEDGIHLENLINDLKKKPELYLLLTVYAKLDNSRETYYNWEGKYRINEAINRVYDLLTKLGYQMSEEEAALQNGTHELFNVE